METQVKIREYNHTDKNDLIQILRLNTPKYFSSAEEVDFLHYLENEIDLYYVLLVENKIIGCGGINSKNETITTFATNQEGFGKFDLLNTSNDEYSLKFSYNNTTYTQLIGKPAIEGINSAY